MIHAAWVIPAFPLAGFALLVLAGRKLGDPWAGWLATLMAAGGFAATVVTFIGLSERATPQRLFVQDLWSWLPVGGFKVDVALQVDPLSITMALFVTGVGSLIHLYSIGYMKDDPRFSRFFVYLNLFLLSMLMLVLGSNFLVTFLGWEGVGTCSYLLISFWFERESAASAGKKAFVTNRIGDWGFMVAMFLVFAKVGSLDFVTVFAHTAAFSRDTATWVCLAFFLGVCGKSAQLPLFVWLPDAMEGPTPVSALIHAATMVTAGVYLLARINPLLVRAPGAQVTVACVGAATALVAATIACAQDDIKRVLAYSTISQLGYMVMAIGAGAYVAGLFHMVTHAFFKALLFLCAGAVIHGLHDQQDMKKMGGLLKSMRITGATFLVGWLAISGIPPFAGFWSKDDILAGVWVYHGTLGHVLWGVGFLTAGLTAYYMSRQVGLVFFGKERFAHEEVHPHEAAPTMWIPLVLLAGLALVGGALNLPVHPVLEKWLDPVLGGSSNLHHMSTTGKWIAAGATTLLCAGGIFAGLRTWIPSASHDELEPEVLERAWFIDWAYGKLAAGPGLAASNFAAYVVDKQIVDGAVNGVGVLVRDSGRQLRKLQTGYVRNYALGIAAGTVAILAYVVLRAG